MKKSKALRPVKASGTKPKRHIAPKPRETEPSPAIEAPEEKQLPERLDDPYLLMRLRAPALALALPNDKLEDFVAAGGRVIRPTSISDILGQREASAVDMLGDLRAALALVDGKSEKGAAAALCEIAVRLVEKLNRLAERGALHDAPAQVQKWPILFAPGASEGASKMKDEVALFEALKVGTRSFLASNPRSRAGIARKGKGGWRRETEAALEAARANASWFNVFVAIQGRSRLDHTRVFYHERMTEKYPVKVYHTPNGRVLLWPWWMDDFYRLVEGNPATGLPFFERLDKDSVERFLPVVRGLFLWRLFYEGHTATLQRRVIDWDEAGDLEVQTYQPDLVRKILVGAENTLYALAGMGRRGST